MATTSTFVYPENDLDRPAKLSSLLGGFWDGIYDDALPTRFAYWRAQLEKETANLRNECEQVIGVNTTPILSSKEIQHLIINESDLNSVYAVARYGELFPYGNYLSYGQAAQRPLTSFPLPDGLKHVNLISNRLFLPSVTLFEGTDFYLNTDLGFIQFRENPFLNPLFAITNIYENNELVDRSLSLWLRNADYDKQLLSKHHGSVFNVRQESSTAYKKLLTSLYGCSNKGSSYSIITSVVSAVLDVPNVKNKVETVEEIVDDGLKLVIATDTNVYVYKSGATPVVSVGDSVYQHDFLTDSARISEFQAGAVPAGVYALALDNQFLSADYTGSLSFINADVPLIVETVAAKTKVSFELGGWEADVSKFWNEVHSRGLENGQTLANLLDERENPSTEPLAGALPATINPLEFLIQNVLRNNAFLLFLRLSKRGEDFLPIKRLELLRKLLPPHTTLIILIQLDEVAEDNDLNTIIPAGGTLNFAPGVSVSLALTSISLASTTNYTNHVCITISGQIIGGSSPYFGSPYFASPIIWH